MKRWITPTIPLLWSLALAGAPGELAAQSVSGDSGKAEAGAAAAHGATISELLADADPYSRVRRLAQRLPDLDRDALPELRMALEGASLGMGIAEFELLVRTWARLEPLDATRWALSLEVPRYRYPAIDAAVEVWAEVDPTEAVAQVTLAAQSAVREEAQTVQLALVRGWFRSDRPGLEAYMKGLGSGVQQQRSILGFAIELQRAEGSDAVARWAASLSEEEPRYKRAAYRQVTTALAWVDPEGSERWCDAHCDGPYGRSLRTAIVRVRMRTGEDEARILRWVIGAPAGRSRDHALGSAFQMWAQEDREAAIRWMEEKLSEDPEPPWLVALHGPFARQLAAISPPEAIAWAERVESDSARQELLVRISRRWLREDPEAAEAWLESSTLPPAARRRARNLKLPDYLPRADSG